MNIHCSKEPNLKFYDTIAKQRSDMKPVGLWYGIDDSWIDWCKTENFDGIHPYRYQLTLNYSVILKITTYKELLTFQEQFKANDDLNKLNSGNIYSIDWVKVANLYSGIEISPYIYRARFTSPWYYGWDVASGCIWNKSAVVDICLIR